MKTRRRIIILLLLLYSWCFEDELVGKPSALSLSTLWSIYCLMTPFTHLHNNNNANDSNNVIMHRHPRRDNMLHTIAMQIMALQSRVRDGLRVCPLFIIHRGFRTQTDRQTHTHTLSSLFGSAVYLVFIRDPVLLCQGPTNPPHSTQTQLLLLFACREFGSWLRGPCARDKTHFTALDGAPNTSPHAHTYSLLVH